MNQYSSVEESAALVRPAKTDEIWLEQQLSRIIPDRDEMGGIGMTRALEQLVFELKRDCDHWRANHDAQVMRARVLIERTDMPLERVQAYEQIGILKNLLSEVSGNFTRDDDLPDYLLPRIDAAIGRSS